MNQAKIIITGCYRSGTTFLQKSLDANKDCKILFQPAIDYFKLIDEKIRKKQKKISFKNFPIGISKINKKIRLGDISIKKSTLIKLTKKIINSKIDKYFRHADKKYYTGILSNLINENKTISCDKLIEIIFNQVSLTYKKKKIIGIKQPFLGDLAKILIKKKDFYVINLIRDPREIVFSRNYSKLKKIIDFKRKKHPVILSSLLCMRNMLLHKNLKKNPNYISIKFNDLINKTNKIEKKINKLLNTNISLNLSKTQKKKKWKINSSGNYKGGYGKKWNKEMNEKDIAIIEKICAQMMKKFKFNFYFKDIKKREFLVSNFRENKNKILKWTNKNIFIKYNKTKIDKL